MRAPSVSILATAVVAILAVCASGKPAPDLQVTAVRYWTLGDVTRVAIEVNGDFSFRRDRLNNPDRLFFDIIDARPNLSGSRYSTRQVNDKILKQIRIAETIPGRTRIVLDLYASVDYTVSKLENPDRLMIELRGPGSSSGTRKSDAPSTPAAPSPTSGSPAPSNPTPATPAAPAPTVPPPITPPAISASTSVSNPPVATTDWAKPVHSEPIAIVSPPPAIAPDTSVIHVTTTPAKPPTEPIATPAHKATSDGSRSLIRALGLKINRVVIDAGHGGHDVGTTGVTGLLEKDLVLDVALRLGKLVEQRMGVEVVYTREDDSYVALEERTAIANRSHADLFLSIHANSSPLKNVAGVETFYLNFTSSSETLDVATRENASSHRTIYELRDMIQSISLHDKIDESKEFAVDVQRTMQANAVKYISTAKDRGIKKAPFVVLIGAQMPSVLSEIGFISNPREEALLKRPDHRQQIAEALYKGLARYSDSLSHIQVASQATVPVASTK
jgi:N-acetylmuramoyl-L-alanine amidase